MKGSDGYITLYRCAALRASITERQCRANYEQAKKAPRALGSLGKGSGKGGIVKLTAEAAAHAIGLGACIGCPGVKALGEPNIVDGVAMVERAKAAHPERGVISGSPLGMPRRAPIKPPRVRYKPDVFQLPKWKHER